MLIAIDSSNVTDTVFSDNRGFYAFSHLKKGQYRIEVRATGFQDAILENIKVRKEMSVQSRNKDVSSATRLNIVLKVKPPK